MVKRKSINKKYIYLRDNKRCYYCGKPLKPGQMTLDHYQPLSRQGTDDYFNLVTCCRLCNKYKKNRLPVDKDMVHLRLFHKAWEDRKIIWAVKGFKKKETEEMVSKIETVLCFGEYSMAKGEKTTLYVRNNVIFRLEGAVR